jgi:hypothetical protein
MVFRMQAAANDAFKARPTRLAIFERLQRLAR